MKLTSTQSKAAWAGGGGVVALIVGFGLVLPLTQNHGAAVAPPVEQARSAVKIAPPPVDPAIAAREALLACDRLAADSTDPKRIGPGVADSALAPGLAVPACEQAVALNPAESMAKFELGRSYRAAARDLDATSKFAEAAEAQYPAAYKALGDIYLDVSGRGLPPGEEPNANKALENYKLAASLGYPDGATAVQEATTMIRRNTFDRSDFQNADYMEGLYNGTAMDAQFKIAEMAYIRGMLETLDGDQAIFIDQSCKPLISLIGLTAVNIAQSLSYLDGIIGSSYKYDRTGISDGAQILMNMIITGGQHFAAKVTYDQGKRDAVVLFDKDAYGCRSTVTKRVLQNVMLTTRKSTPA